jgi:NAD+ synthase (glutamine-hydrolysing)
MPNIKIAAGVVNQTPMAWASNRNHILEAIAEAQRQDVSLLCLPELCITGYGCEDAFYGQDIVNQAFESLLDIVPHTENIAVSVGLPVHHHHKLYNAHCLIVNKRIQGLVLKQNLANNGIHYETRWFHAWPAGQRDEIKIGEFNYPIGDLVFELDGVRIGYEICEDAWVAQRPGRALYERGVDIILNPSASHFGFFKSQTRERFVIDASRAFGCSYLYTNLLGNEAGRAIYDGDAMIASDGSLLVSGPRFSYADSLIVTAVIDTDQTRLNQIQNRAPLPQGNWKVPVLFDFPEIKPVLNQKAEFEYWEKDGFLKEEEFARAVSMALFDYLRKSRSNGFVISLSGGADSSSIAALCYLATWFAHESIGLDKFKAKLSHIKAIQAAQTIEDVANKLIYTIYQGTQNSSDATYHSAKTLATYINATFYNININGLVEHYRQLIEDQIGRKLSWETDDIALQNIQARVRAPSAWLLTNISNALLLSTSNRSEAAVGYATMDGDTSGSISPIAGIDKHWLRHWLLWAEHEGIAGKLKLAGLSAVNNLQPTAELRPLDKNQTDEDDLMPYDVLNQIENWAIRDKKSPIEVFKRIEIAFSEKHSREKLLLWTERFFKLWARNQWKRERYAPSFHLDDHNLDPRSWCRFPILSGGFEKELADLQVYFNEKSTNKRKGKIGF